MYRKTWMEINLDAVKANFLRASQISGKKMIAVLKADAYGCGDIQIAEALMDVGLEMIAVSSLDEALMLRNRGYAGPILILGGTNAEDIPTIIENQISIAGYSTEWVDQAAQMNPKGLKVHLAVDTGMNRIGFRSIEELRYAYDTLAEKGCQLEGIFTHFYCSDAEDHVITNQQYALFSSLVRELNHPFEWIHCDNSDATLFFQDDLSNACRFGISLYGVSPYLNDLAHPISLYTEVVMTKTVQKGQTIGYGATYTAQQDEIIATLPIGYADGLIRKNQGRFVYVDGQYAEIVGRVCMDQCMIRLKHDVKPGTKVEIFGPHISLEKMAEELDTIPYEIICLITGRVTRTYVNSKSIVMEKNPRLLESTFETGK